jgi:quinol-cytochrome oxidoreductase complex cytochrome b subunit
MLRVFFTGSYRKPRELNWLVGFLLFVLAMAEGFTGYSLPDDLLSGNGLRIIDGMVKGIPIIGTWTSNLLFGGEFPGTQVVGMFYSLHILLLPAIIVALIGVHMVLLVVNKHTQFSGPGRTNDNVVGVPIMPVFAAKAGGFFFIIFGVIVLVGATVTINPIWAYGPYDPSPVSAGTQPDWYIGFADGALRLVPPGWELELFGFTLSLNILVPLLVLPLFLAVVALYPFLEGWVTGDQREHHMTDRPRNAPKRTAIGAAGVTFYAVLWAAAGSDLIATHFRLSIEGVTLAIQILLFVGPVVAYIVAHRICIGLQKKDREIALHGYETARIVRLPGGEYIEVHEQLSDYERWKLVDFDESPRSRPPGSTGTTDPRADQHRALPGSEEAPHILGALVEAEPVVEAARAPAGDRQLGHASPLALGLDGADELGAVGVATRLVIHHDLLQLRRRPVGRQQRDDGRQGVALQRAGVVDHEQVDAGVLTREVRRDRRVEGLAHRRERMSELADQREQSLFVARACLADAGSHGQRAKLPR